MNDNRPTPYDDALAQCRGVLDGTIVGGPFVGMTERELHDWVDWYGIRRGGWREGYAAAMSQQRAVNDQAQAATAQAEGEGEYPEGSEE